MSLHVERTGAGAPLALLHGWALHSGAWDGVAARLATRHELHAIDLPGHGRSREVAPTTLDAAADAIAALLPVDCAVCGWSLGALIALRIALRHPGKARALVLVGATPCFVERDDWPHGMAREVLEEFAEGLAHDRGATLARFVRLNALLGSGAREAIRDFTGQLSRYGTPEAPDLRTTLGWLRETDARDDLPAVAQPVLLIHGARDMLAPVRAARWMAERLPRATLVEFADAAHLPFFSHPGDFAKAVERFVG